MGSWIRTLLSLTLAGPLVLAPRAGAAQPDDPRTEFKRAQQAYQLGRFDEALAGFSALYERDPRPELLFNLAQCHRQLGEHARAAFLYEQYLDAYPDGAPSEALVKELLAEVQSRAAEQRQPPPGPPLVSQVLEPIPDDAPLPMRPAGPIREPLPPSLSPPDAAPETAAAVPVSTRAPREAERRALTRSGWFWVAAGAVAVGLAAGTVAWVSRDARPQPTLGTGDLR